MARKRGIRIVIVVEDSMLDRFCRTALRGLGYHKREIRVEMAPPGKGSAKQWTDARLAIEVATIRTRPYQKLAVLVGSDVDELAWHDRVRQLTDALEAAELAPRGTDERIAWWLPKWSVETWLLHFAGEKVDEATRYKHKVKSPDCKRAAHAFIAQYRESRAGKTTETLPALREAHGETIRIDS